jgi:hypothetical protein
VTIMTTNNHATRKGKQIDQNNIFSKSGNV